MHFIVTGGAGFIGSHVTEQLLSEGHEVTVVDNLVTGNLENLSRHSRLRYLSNDVLACHLNEFVQPIDGLAHLAATPSVTQSWMQPLAAHHNNLSAMVAMLELCQALRIPRLVFASSAAVYGNTTQLPITESHTTRPISPYGLQKLVSEQYATLLAEQAQLSFVALRLFNVFGPRQQPTSPYSGVISIFTQKMQQGLPLTIYGDGQQTRDFVFVKDVAIAFSKALTVPLRVGESIACNVGTGHRTSLLELVDQLKPCFPHWHADIHFAPARPGDIRDSQADISALANLIGFTPSPSIAPGLQRFAESLR